MFSLFFYLHALNESLIGNNQEFILPVLLDEFNLGLLSCLQNSIYTHHPIESLHYPEISLIFSHLPLLHQCSVFLQYVKCLKSHLLLLNTFYVFPCNHQLPSLLHFFSLILLQKSYYFLLEQEFSHHSFPVSFVPSLINSSFVGLKRLKSQIFSLLISYVFSSYALSGSHFFF